MEVFKNTSLTIRPGTVEDSYAVFHIFEESLADLSRRLGSTTPTSISDPAALARMWDIRRPLYEHLARTADQFWVAERDGRPVGFARSICEGDLQALTELFVLPGQQSGGVGRELMARSFPYKGTTYRSIIASADFRAQALYLKAGVYPRFPIYYFGCTPQRVTVETDLDFQQVAASPETLEILGNLDRQLLGYRRDVTHSWLLSNRQGYLYYRNQQPVGYGYTGLNNGPFAALDARDFPAVLAHAETEAARQGRDHFGVEVPTVNQTAVDYLLGRGFWLDTFIAIFMSNVPFGKFENYVVTSPPFFF